MFTVPKPYPKEFRDDVVNVARDREPGQHLKQIAADLGVSESCLKNWMKAADVEDGIKPGTTAAENASLREALVGRSPAGRRRWIRAVLRLPR
jgi:transposase